MVFGKVTRSVKADTPLIELIAGKCWERKQIPPLTMDSYIRGSAFSSICPREEVLRVVHGIERQDDIGTDLLLTFALGSGMHHALQNRILPQCGILYGSWRCKYCGALYGGLEDGRAIEECLVTRPERCEHCNKSRKQEDDFTFEELFFESRQYHINGHPDGFLKLPEYTGLGLLEVKSISNRGSWEVKHTPKMDHVMQAQIYMWLTGVQWTEILYWDKGTFGITALIEHHVERDEETIDEFKVLLSQLWECISQFKTSGMVQLPDRICVTSDCSRATACSAMLPCFKEAV